MPGPRAGTIAFLFVLLIPQLALERERIGEGAPPPIRNARQCLLVTAQNWQSTFGELQLLERAKTDSPWRRRGAKIVVALGKSGLAWGRGVVAFDRPGPQKMEGDGRSPAGVFRFGTVFGYASSAEAPHLDMPYFPLTQDSEGIDDVQSHYYNQLVRRSAIPHPDWRTSERMLRHDALYRWGIFVEYNTPAVAGGGSCIFLHIWRGPKAPTVGCTAMPESDLKAIIAWLDPQMQPLLVQMPLPEFRRIQHDWFPELEAGISFADNNTAAITYSD